MRAHIALLWLVALGCGAAACSADFGANPSMRCSETTVCPVMEQCYRGFCVQGHELPIEVDGSLSPITEVEAGSTPGLPAAGEAGTSGVSGDAQSPAAPPPVGARDAGPSVATADAGPTMTMTTPTDAVAPVVVPATPPTSAPTTPPAVEPAPTTPAPTPPTTPAPEPTTPAPTTPEPMTPVTPTPVIDVGAPEASVPAPTAPMPTTPPTAEPEQSSPLLLCLAVCLTRSALCLTCLAGTINNDPSVCDERQVRGDRELRELCDWLCTSAECGGRR